MTLFKLMFFQLYLLQLENYDLSRYWHVFARLVMQKPSKLAPRQKLVWTAKAKMVFILALTLAFVPALAFDNIFVKIILWIFFVNIFAPLFLALAVILLWPLDFLAKQIIVSRARAKIRSFPDLKIIGITGSYGKTTMKECLASVLEEKFRVLKTPENINTPVGIGRLILKQLDKSTEIFIVEMGAYQTGDIKTLCRITPPDISILTGINEAHLERFGTIANTIQTKFEIARHAKPGATLVLNEDSQLVKENYSRHAGNRKILWYKNSEDYPFGVRPAILGSYVAGMLSACAAIAKELGLTEEQIKAGIRKIQPIPHRLQQINTGNGVIVIDDSYNGNPEGAKEAVNVLGTFKDRRKVYVTPGLVEMGTRTEAVHRTLGQQLSKVADVLILIKNSVTPYIAEGFSREVIWFDSAKEAHAALDQIIKPGDVVLFQNDWPDNYV